MISQKVIFQKSQKQLTWKKKQKTYETLQTNKQHDLLCNQLNLLIVMMHLKEKALDELFCFLGLFCRKESTNHEDKSTIIVLDDDDENYVLGIYSLYSQTPSPSIIFNQVLGYEHCCIKFPCILYSPIYQNNAWQNFIANHQKLMIIGNSKFELKNHVLKIQYCETLTLSLTFYLHSILWTFYSNPDFDWKMDIMVLPCKKCVNALLDCLQVHSICEMIEGFDIYYIHYLIGHVHLWKLWSGAGRELKRKKKFITCH